MTKTVKENVMRPGAHANTSKSYIIALKKTGRRTTWRKAASLFNNISLRGDGPFHFVLFCDSIKFKIALKFNRCFKKIVM